MSRLVARILLSIFIFPLAGIFYLAVFVIVLDNYRGGGFPSAEYEGFLIADVLTWAAIGLYWCLLWRGNVRWTSRRIGGSILAVFIALLVGAIVGTAIISAAGRGDSDVGIFVGGILAILLWLVATVFLWRETAAERSERAKSSSKSAITCPTCGYNLTGLSESRCPECGSKFTLDQLMALQVTAERDID